MAFSGGGIRFSSKNWEGGIIVTSKFFEGGSVLKHYNHRHPRFWDVINDRSLVLLVSSFCETLFLFTL